MQGDKFNDIIKQKLEGISPEFEEKDWQQYKQQAELQSFLKKPWYTTQLGKIAAGIVITASLAFGAYQYNQNKILKQELAVLNSQKIEVQKQLQDNINAENNSYDPNKLAEHNTNNNLNEIAEITNNAQNKIAENNIENKEFAEIKINKLLEPITIINDNETKEKVEEAYVFKNKNKRNTGKKPKSSDLPKSTQAKTGIWAQYKSRKMQRRTLNQSIHNTEGTLANAKPTVVANTAEEFSITTMSPMLAKNEIKLTNSLKNNISIEALSHVNNLPKPKQKSHFSLADAHMRLGAQGGLSRGTTAYGLKAELFFDQRISLTVGIANQETNGRFIYTGMKNNMQHKTKFEEKNKPKLPAFKEILNLNEQVSTTTVPIRIQYYHPLTQNVHIIGGLGTDLDIKGDRVIDYQYSVMGPFQPTSESLVKKGTITNQLNGSVLNNIAITIGAEKRWGKLGVQAKVNDIFTVKNVDYRKKNSLGVELGVMYRL